MLSDQETKIQEYRLVSPAATFWDTIIFILMFNLNCRSKLNELGVEDVEELEDLTWQKKDKFD